MRGLPNRRPSRAEARRITTAAAAYRGQRKRERDNLPYDGSHEAGVNFWRRPGWARRRG